MNEATRTALTKLLMEGGDESCQCKEHVLQLVPNSLLADRKQATLMAIDKLNTKFCSADAQHLRNRRFNALVSRIAAYATGHVNFRDNSSSNTKSNVISSNVLHIGQQREAFESFRPLLTSLHPDFKLTEEVLTQTKFYDEKAAHELLTPPSTAGNQ
jgi:hypothetical protein